MYKSSKLFLLIVTVFLLVSLIQVECRRTYGTSSSSRGRGNRGKNQPSGGGIFSSWFGGSKSGSSSSVGSSSAFKPTSSTSAKKNWQTATSQVSSPSRTSWSNPNYKPSAPSLSSAPKEGSYGWKPAVASNPKPANPPYPTVNSGSRSYPVQSGIQQSSQTGFGGFKPAGSVPSAPATNYQPSQSSFGGYKPAGSVPSVPATNYQPSQSSFGGYRPASNVPNTYHTPSHSSVPQSGYGGYSAAHPPNTYHASQPAHGYQPSHGVPHQSYPSSAGYHPSSYPQQTGSFSGHYPTQTGFGYSPHSSFGAAAPTYQGTKLFGGSSGHYGYPGSGSWGVPTYGSKSSSGTGKLLTGLAVGAAGGYLTSSLVNSISNPWKYSGYGYGSRYGYGSSYGSDYGRLGSESAFERGYERGVRDRQNENTKVTATEAPPEDPTSKWIQCVAFDPQTQQTLINPNCSCTVTTSLDERTQQPLSVHHCTTLNGLVMRPIPIQPFPQPAPGAAVDTQQLPGGINTPGVVPSYMDSYQGGGQYGGVQGAYVPYSPEQKSAPTATEVKAEVSSPLESTTSNKETEKGSENMKSEDKEKKESESTTGSSTEGSQVVSTSSSKSSDPEINKESAGGSPGADDNRKSTAEFYGQLQKIVNMGNFVDEG